MYAVIKTGGKQYRVAVGDKLKVESLNAQEGETITLDQVLMITDGDKVQVGTPLLDTSVQAKVNSNGRGKKLRIVKFRRRQNSRTRTGHRQNYTELEITSIGGKSAEKKTATEKPSTKPKAEAAVKAKTESKAKQSEPESSKDDLTKISGVGPVIVGKLENMGITTFQQIADLTAQDIAQIDEKLNFKGRIERDNWIDQAKEFLKA